MRPVHYTAHGRGGLAFRCYFDDLNRHVASGDPRTIPSPRSTTDLRKVTCAACWVEIAAMAKTHRDAAETRRLNQQVAEIVERQRKAARG